MVESLVYGVFESVYGVLKSCFKFTFVQIALLSNAYLVELQPVVSIQQQIRRFHHFESAR